MPDRFPPLTDAEEALLQRHFHSVTHIQHLGAALGTRRRGYVEMILPVRPELTNEMDYVHGGVISTLADTAAGHAAMTVIAEGWGTTTVEFKINFLAPAIGQTIIARSSVKLQGRSLTILDAEVYAVNDGVEKHCATGIFTYMNLPPKE